MYFPLQNLFIKKEDTLMTHDLVIIGGAMTGVTLALALSSQTQGKMKIAIVERQPLLQHCQSGFDARCIALSAGSCQKFSQIQLPNQQNVWQKIQGISTAIRQIHVSDQGHSGILEFCAEEFHLAELGAVIELSQTGKLLLEMLKLYPQVEYLSAEEVHHIEQQQEWVKITLKNHRTLQTKLLVGADGSKSQVAKTAGIQQQIVREYGQTAIISNLLVQKNHDNRAFERFTSQGPLAFLPMQNNLMSVVWCVKNPDEIMALNDQEFLQQLQHQFGWRLGKMLQTGKRFAYPLNLHQAERHIQHRIALIGNAAQTLHPVAGQGFNLGIRDLMVLADLVATAYKKNQDWGTLDYLQQYEQNRLSDQQKIIRLTDGLLSIFANNLLPLQIGRNLGLMGLSHCSLLRQWFAKPTLGW